MSRKKIRTIIVSVSIFYLIVAVMSIFMLKENDSVLAEKNMAQILFGKETDTNTDPEAGSEADPEEDPDGDPDRILEKWTDTVTEKATEAVTEKVTEAATEKVTEAVTEKVTEAVTAKATEAVTEKATEAVTAKATEAVTEKATEAASENITDIVPQTDGKYYIVETTNQKYLLIMREAAAKRSKAVTQLKPQTTGVVIEKEDQWTKIYADGKIGYCYNQYLQFREVTKEEYDKQVLASGQVSEGVQNGH